MGGRGDGDEVKKGRQEKERGQEKWEDKDSRRRRK